jgi:MinD-like ATPase involved in chromosome partitioning or flagellar assembly
VSRVCLWLAESAGDRLAGELVVAGSELVRRVTTGFEITELIDAGAVDIAVVNADPAVLTLALIDACDIAGVRLIALTRVDADRRHARTLDFHETCPSESSWTSMVELLRPASLSGDGIPDLSFFDITSDAPPRVIDSPGLWPSASTDVPDPDPIPSGVHSPDEELTPLRGDPRAPRKNAAVIAVWGPTGAPGRTSVAINVAAELTILGHSVLLIDADPYGGAIAPKLGLLDETPGFAAACRLADQELLTRHELERLSQLIDFGGLGGPGGTGGRGSARNPLWVLTGILRADRWPELSASRVARVLEMCRELFDIVVVDVGFNLEQDEEISSDLVSARRNASTLTVLGEANTILAVADSDVVGLARFLRASADLREAFVGTPVIAVANRVRSLVAGIAPRAQVRQTLERFGGLSDIVLLAQDERAFDACSLRTAPLCSVAPKSAVRVTLRDLALRLAPEPVTAGQSPSQGKRASGSKLFARRRG